ncbi:metal ABC transporter substrate-binding protein [Staphylothermus hellenicus]|uniref:Periplasmic solute binding protein n=1 Tax=Staphylothermus hellenicus (strain DSM 12710 / JCM 10830 / BK20S6-10-b1 / P8) TaxID=591019 RepID=D7DBM1_STAHD|nr:zinc ABC transporter substrate-binding protein [Staphylothermus hellenicus]ADI31568.1 periplasmic solute binding protein [Staphylothermus hellenicus DSM 12710]
MKIQLLQAYIAILLITTALLFNTIPVYSINIHSINTVKGLFIVVSFPNLISDIKQLTADNDQVVSVAPQGIDPHEYSLTPKNVEDLEKADIIISLAHAPFEKRIHDLYVEGKLKGVLVEIPYIPGIIIRENPATHMPSYHMIIYDPFNYIVFIKYVAQKMGELNPEYKTYYLNKAKEIIKNVSSIIAETPQLNIVGVADTPVTVYSVEWLGIDIRYLLIKEHGVQMTPQDLINVENGIKNKTIQAAIVTEPAVSQASKKLLELANKYSIPIIHVPSPLTQQPIPAKLAVISKEVIGLSENKSFININISSNTSSGSIAGTNIFLSKYYYDLVLFIIGSIIAALTIYEIIRRNP